MSEFLFEHMIRAETADHVCRIWRQADGDPKHAVANEELKRLAITLLVGDTFALKEVVTTLISFDRVNSVEIIRRGTGDGLCVHKDWP